MKLFSDNRILVLHPIFWAFFATVIIVVRLLTCGYEDYNKKKAYIDGQTAVIMSLPVEQLSELKVNSL